MFEGDVDFRGAKFENFAYFKNVEFKGVAKFRGCEFKGEAWFSGSKFKRLANFDGATFRGDAMFEGCRFYSNVGFFAALFEGKANFIRCEFHGELSLGGMKVLRNIIQFNDSDFKFRKTEVVVARFSRKFYEEEGNRDESDEWFVRERRALRRWRLLEAGFPFSKKIRMKLLEPHIRNIVGDIGEDELKKYLEKAAQKLKYKEYKWFSPKDLREILQDNEGKHHKNKSHVIRYIKALFLALLSYVSEYLIDILCKYGTSWTRPIFWWFIIAVGFSFLYYFLKGVTPLSGDSLTDFLKCLYFSVTSSVTLGYGDVRPVRWGKVLVPIEAILGNIMLAVFLTVMARKYMR